MTIQVEKVLSTAKSQVGYREGYSGGHWNNNQKYSKEAPGMAWSNGQAWCCTFCSWVAYKAGVSDLFPRTAGCSIAIAWFKNSGRFSEYPAIGAQVFYGPGGASHTGIVYAYDSEFIYTYEGNTNADGSPEGNGVYAKKRARRSTYVYGYGLPRYAEGVTTADPSKRGKAGWAYRSTATGPAGTAPSKVSTARTTVVTVKPHQTLGAIAAAAGVSLASVLGVNPGVKNPDLVHPGERITVPVLPKASATAKPKATVKPKTSPKPKAATKSTSKPTKHTAAKPPAFPGRDHFRPGVTSPYVTELGKALVRRGYGRYYSVGPGPHWTNSDRTATRAFQRAQGWTASGADGYPGPLTWARLMG
jgi:LysM repeat protein